MKSFEKASLFIYMVKQRFANEPSKFDEFAKILTNLPLERDGAHLISKLEGLFEGQHPDLISGLHEFYPNKYKTPVVVSTEQVKDREAILKKDDHHDQPRKKKRKHEWLLRDTPSYLFNRIRDRCVEKDDDEFRVLMEFSRIILSYNEKEITYSEADTMFKKLFKDDPDLFLEANCVLSQSLGEPVRYSGWTGEKGSSGVVCSLYEETMDVKEFYLFEMGLAFSRLDSTIKKLEKPESLEEGLTELDFRCIKKLYDDSDDDREGLGEEMVHILKFDRVRRVAARVVVLERLRVQRKELEEQKLHLNKIWNEIFEDIKEKGRVMRHREFLQNTKKASTNGFVSK